MSKQTDKRNWKCFFGMHQYSILENIRHKHTSDFNDFKSTRYSINIIRICDFCGKIKHNEIHL